MKVTLSVCIIFAVAYATAEPIGKCPEEMRPEEVDFLVDSADCSVFYKCNLGKPVKYNCPDNLHFNKELKMCDWPEAAKCSGNGGGDNNSGNGGNEENGRGKCPDDPCPKVNGIYPKYFAHPETCSRFCQCDLGVAYDIPCPEGLHFNTKLNVCDRPEKAGCKM